MTEKICRFCFENKTRPIGIFTTKGIKLKMSEIIRMHFPDKPREYNSRLPNFVCLYCWTKLANFHKFYNAVETAKNIYLASDVKTEEPNITVVNCDPIEFDDDAVKSEPKEESAPFGKSAYENNGPQDMELNRDSNDYDGAASVLTSTAFATSFVTKKSIAKSKNNIDHLVADYIEMACEICQHPFKTLKKARGHLRGIHKLRSIKVKCCQRKVDLYDISGHIQSHLNPEIYTCEDCKKTFFLKSALRIHRLNHMPKRFECDISNKKYLLLPGLRNHILTAHVGGKRYECEICGKQLAWRMSLLTHVKFVHGQQNQQVCHICARVYSSPASLRRHLKEHSGVEEPRITCKICGRSCKNEIALRKHMTIHEDEGKSFPCPDCQKVYSNRMALAAHVRGNHSFKLHKCHLCDKEFKRAITLKEHVATHTGAFLYNCNYCPEKFKRSCNLYPHYKEFHPAEWSVDRYKSTRK